ncbi:MAG: glycosyltransferase family 4 protein [Anaerolineales bacterium]|nr:glycosyltransferase family 4 protein [Anaerolineales bacterium]
MSNTGKLRVLFCRSNPVAPDPRVEKAVRTLSEAGYDVSILCWDRTGELPARDLVSGIHFFRLPIKAQYGTGMGNFSALLRWQWALLRWLISHRREYDLIHACDFDTVLPAMICKLLFGKKIIYDIFDFYADHLRATPRWIKDIIRTVDLRVIKSVDGLIVTDDSRWEQIGLGPPPNSAIIYNTPQDVRKISGFENHPAPSRGLRLVYVGLLQVERGLLDILPLLQKHSNWHLDLAGFGGDEEQILALAEGLPNVRWRGRIPYQQALALTNAADVVLALYDPSLPNHRYASPNKLFEAMMLSKPVIVAENTNIDKIVSQENCGIVVTYGSRAELGEVLDSLLGDMDLRRELGANGRRAYERHYNWSKMGDRLRHLYAQLG